MKIAIATNGKKSDSSVPQMLVEAEFLFITDMEKFEVLNIYEADAKERDVTFARRTVEEDCEAIICGQIEKEAFDILAQACVTRFDGSGKGATEAIKLMNVDALPLIRDHIAGPGCPGHDSGGECHEHGE